MNISSESTEPYSTSVRQFVVCGVITLLVVILGIFGNCYSFKLLSRNLKLRKSMALHLSSLAFWDMCLLMAVIPYYSMSYALVPLVGKWIIFDQMTIVAHPIANITMTGSIWTVLMITIVQFKSIYRPLSHRISDTIRRAHFTNWTIAFFAVLFNLPTFFELDIHLTNSTSQVDHRIIPTPFRQNYIYIWTYHVALGLLCKSLVPFLIIILLTIAIGMILTSAKKIRGNLVKDSQRQRQRTENNVTRMLLIILLKFFLCQTLPQVSFFWDQWLLHGGGPGIDKLTNSSKDNSSQTAYNSSEPQFRDDQDFLVLVDISNFLVVLNSASNCLVYIFWKRRMGKRRRQNTEITSTLTDYFDFKLRMRGRHDEIPESELLQKIWNVHFKTMRPCIGTKIMNSLMSRRENQFYLLKSKQTSDLTGGLMESHGSKITTFIRNLIPLFQELKKEKFAEEIKKFMEIHSKIDVTFSNVDYVEIRKLLELNHSETLTENGLEKSCFLPVCEQRDYLWRKFVCNLIRCMKMS